MRTRMKNPRDKRRTGMYCLVFLVGRADPSDRTKGNLEASREDLRTQFYTHYRKEAEEYDNDFMKKYDEDLNTTLIFVRCMCRPGPRVLTRVTGWSILRCGFRLYHRGQLSTPTRPQR